MTRPVTGRTSDSARHIGPASATGSEVTHATGAPLPARTRCPVGGGTGPTWAAPSSGKMPMSIGAFSLRRAAHVPANPANSLPVRRPKHRVSVPERRFCGLSEGSDVLDGPLPSMSPPLRVVVSYAYFFPCVHGPATWLMVRSTYSSWYSGPSTMLGQAAPRGPTGLFSIKRTRAATRRKLRFFRDTYT